MILSSSCFYGAVDLLQLDVFSKLFTMTSVSWTHGVVIPSLVTEAFYEYRDSINTLHLVTNQKQKELLEELGVVAYDVGLPYLYANNNEVKNQIYRTYFPRHVIRSQNQTDGFKSIFAKAQSYNCDAVCIPANTYNRLFGVKSNYVIFGDLRIFKGAAAGDYGSLTRLSKIFSQTDTVVTDIFGSHVFYAFHSGCMIVFAEDMSLPSYSQQEAHHLTKNYRTPWKEVMVERMTNGTASRYFEYFQSLDQKERAIEVADMLGVNSLRKSEELKSLIAQNARLSDMVKTLPKHLCAKIMKHY